MLFEQLLTRNNLPHLLLSEVVKLQNQIQREFPEIVSLKNIGETWEMRNITVITLDARNFVNSEEFKTAYEIANANKTVAQKSAN